jgi:hypothetical protein
MFGTDHRTWAEGGSISERWVGQLPGGASTALEFGARRGEPAVEAIIIGLIVEPRPQSR